MRASRLARASATAIVLIAAALIAVTLPGNVGPVDAAPRSDAFDLSRYRPVNPDTYRSLSYANRGRHFFVSGTVRCQIGPQPNAAACRVKPRTASPGVIGVALPSESQGPYWVRRGSSYQLGPVSPFRTPTLKAGTRVTVANITCAAPKTGVVICRNWNRGFKVSRSAHTFRYPHGDRAHDRNPRVRR
ncbi:hypothetical protein [Gordonia hydrophobica]|uniref:Ig-like domain-containing protein n=1 Tax=Gordonia hydrophobica TaxID=40516 RepID=A0ABZ2U5T1_9ACTN|nr:hypothetical protein [Gordonia hydrophobica]MBM7368809.1 hypothetical protein [Gordonia hydrophobica]